MDMSFRNSNTWIKFGKKKEKKQNKILDSGEKV
jgi:hypothetical protein